MSLSLEVFLSILEKFLFIVLVAYCSTICKMVLLKSFKVLNLGRNNLSSSSISKLLKAKGVEAVFEI